MKRMKKLMSVLMAIVMVMSLSVTALADDPAPVTTYDNAKGNSTGTGTNEGPMEDHPIKIVLPTVADGTYNMILDPHDLLARTNNKKFTGKTFVTNYSDATKTNNRLFFNDSTDHYDGKSASATVTNKSFDDVNLIVTVEVDPKTNTFDFIDAPSALDDTLETAQMYLAVTDGTQTAAVAAPPADAEGTLGDPTATVTNDGAEHYLTGATFAWTADATDELKTSLNEGFDGVKIKPTVSLESDSDGKYHITVEGATAIVVDDGATVEATSGTDSLVVDIYNGDATVKVATLTLTLDSSKLLATGGASEVTLAKGVISQPKSSAQIVTKIAGNSDAYSEDYDSTNGYTWAFDNSKTFADASFNLIGNINGVDAWDGQSDTGNEIGVKVIWEVEAYVASESGNSGNGGQNANVSPTATVTQTAAAAGTATVTYTLGSKAKVNRVIYTRSGAVNEATFTDNNGTLSVTMPAVLIYNQSSDWKVEFTDADGSNPVTVDINPKA